MRRSHRSKHEGILSPLLCPKREHFKRERLTAEYNRVFLKLWHGEIRDSYLKSYLPIGVETSTDLSHLKIILMRPVGCDSSGDSSKKYGKLAFQKLASWLRVRFSKTLALRRTPNVSLEVIAACPSIYPNH